MAKEYETIQVLEIRDKTESSYLYETEGKRGAPRDVIYPLNFHPAASLKLPRGTAARAKAGDQEAIDKLCELAKERGIEGKAQFRLAVGGNGQGGVQVRAKLATGGARRGFQVIIKEVDL